MKKNVQRILATILTVIMMISMLPSNVFAADFDADMFVEPAVEAVSVPAEEQEVESTVEYIYEEPAETLQGSSDEIQTVEAADPAADEIEEETEAPVVDGTVTLKAEGSDYIVTVTYDVSAGLPADADIRVKEVMENNKKYDDYVEKAANTIDSDVEALNYVRLFDISIVDADGNKVEPTGPVDVQIILKDVEAVEETTQVVHFAGEDEVPEVVVTTVEDDTVSFATEGFSIYAVVTSGEYARLEVNFDNSSDGAAKTMYVKQRDITEGRLNEVLYDPGVPVVSGQKFLGWTDEAAWENKTIDELKADAMTIDDVRDDVTASLNAGVEDGDSVTYHAIMVNCFELYYQDEDNNTLKTENVLSTGNSGSTIVDLEYSVKSENPNLNFVGWRVNGTTEPVYANGDSITISEDTILVPALGEGKWLFFDSNAGGAGVSEASYTPPQFIPAGGKATAPADPTRPGYTFAGWYVGSEDNAAEFNFNKEMNEYTAAADGYVYAYAHWTPNPTGSYKVVIWAQKVTDDKNAADEDKTYDYVGTFTINDAIAGTPLTEEELGQSSDKYFEKDNEYFGATDLENGSTAFEYNRFEVKNGIGTAQNGVSPDNSTVVNVYYDRALMTIAFTSSATNDSGSLPQEVYYYATNDTSGTIYGRVNGNYVRLTRRAAGKRVEWGKYTSGTPTYYDPAPQYIWTNRTSAVNNSTNDRYSVSAVEQANASTINNASVGTSFTRINTSTMVFQTGSQGSQFYARVGSSAELAACYVLQNYAFTVTDSGEEYTGTIYKQATRQGMTGLYGQSLSKYNYSWPTPSAGGTWDGVSYLDAFTGSFFGAEYFGGAPNVIELDRDTEQTNLTVVYYLQDKDDPDKYNRIDSVRYPLDTTSGGKFKLTERILGGTSKDYAWSASDSIPAEGSSWHTEKDSGGRTGYTREEAGNGNQNSITHLHIRYIRETHDIIYMQGTKPLKTVSGVPYEASLADYAGTLPEDSDVTIPEGEFFSGWFEDPEGVKRVDWDGTMPLGNKIIYAVVRKAQYHVVIDMDGGTLPNNQSTEFWEDAGRIIDDTNFKNATKTDAQGNVYTLVGYYTDEGLTELWNFDIALNNDYLWHIYDDTDGDDPLRDAEFFEKGNDVGWHNVAGIFRLFAKWKNDDILSKGGLHIEYTNPTDAPAYSHTDEMHYADLSDVIAAQAPTEDYWPDDMRFDGWKLKEGEVYQPGDVFVASSSDANFVNNQYTITLTATYVEKEDRTPTHITWYKNYDDKTGNPSYAESPNLGINEAWPIYGAADSGYPVPTREGHTFLGWAKATEKEDEGDTPNTIINVTEDDYFLDYKNGKFYVHGTDNEAEAVAADEVLPYDGLYAIWKDEQIHIYHSSDGATEVSIPEKDGDTLKKVDLTGYVKSGYIYGGYYEYDKDDTGDPIHRGTAITSEPGTAVTPEAGKWYYLKEVDPTKYLLPNIYVTWLKATSRELRNFYVLADTDEAQYQNIGVYVDVVDKDGNKKERETYGLTSGFYDKLTVTQSGSTLGEYTTKNIFGYEGVFGMSMKADAQKYAIDHTLKDAEITLTAYYTTLDGVLVTGTTQKKYNLGDQTCQSWAAPGIRAVATGTATPTYGAVLESAGSPAMAYRGTYQLKSEPEISKYTVTKIDNGKTVTQEVQAGDNTGKITYSGKTGYVFAGWYLDKSYKKKADFSAVAGNMTVYAKYVKTSAIGLSFTKKSSKSGSVILNATLKITDAPDITDVAVDCGYNGKASAVKFTGVKTTKSGKTTINTYTGTVTISGLANKKSFTVAISYRTPDGTTVNLADKTCKYVSGSVTVK